MTQWRRFSNPSLWREIAVGLWDRPSEPAIYGDVQVRADRMLEYLDEVEEASGEHVTPTAFFVRVLAEFFRRHPGLNTIVVGNEVRRRRDVDIFCQVAISGEGEADADLSGFKIPNCDERDLVEIARFIRMQSEHVRRRDESGAGRQRALLGAIPAFAMPFVMRLLDALTFLVPFESEQLGIGSDPFGSAMLSNVGVFGIERAFAPLVPWSRSPLVVLPGAIHEEAVVEEGEIVRRKVVELCCTADHRCYDGSQAGIFVDEIRAMIENPRQHFGNPDRLHRERAAE